MRDIIHKRMQFLGEFDGIDFYRYSPALLRPYYMAYPKQDHPPYEKRGVHQIRMLLEYLRGGYHVIYMVREGEILGHLVVARGGRRLAVSTPEDIVVGPIFVSPSLRGQGIGTIGIRVVLNELGLKYRYAYEFIRQDNIASIRTVEKNGYVFVERAREQGLMKNLVSCPDGDFVVYCYELSK
jgi:GNAT superfamily N-acetyltransferase